MYLAKSEIAADFVDDNDLHVVRWVMFCDPNRNTLTCSVAEDGSVAGVGLSMDYETKWAIDDGEFNPADIFNYGFKSAPEGGGPTAFDAPSSAYATGDVFMREGPGRSYAKVGLIPSGTRVDYLNQSQADERGVLWYYVDHNGTIGWASSKYVSLGT